ncbi:hypothetical protein VTO73DRAFT_15239 [Trametes versicolor]
MSEEPLQSSTNRCAKRNASNESDSETGLHIDTVETCPGPTCKEERALQEYLKKLGSALVCKPSYCQGTIPPPANDCTLFYGKEASVRCVDLAHASPEGLQRLADACDPTAFGRGVRMCTTRHTAMQKAGSELLVEGRTDSTKSIQAEVYKLNVYANPVDLTLPQPDFPPCSMHMDETTLPTLLYLAALASLFENQKPGYIVIERHCSRYAMLLYHLLAGQGKPDAKVERSAKWAAVKVAASAAASTSSHHTSSLRPGTFRALFQRVTQREERD